LVHWMVPDPVSQILAGVRLASPPVALAAAISTGALIFAPKGWLDVINLENAREYYRVEIGFVFLASFAFLIAFSWPVIRNFVRGKIEGPCRKEEG